MKGENGGKTGETMGAFLSMAIRLGAGVGIFLYGLQLISSYLEELAGPVMEKGLQRLTGNVWIGSLTGTVITALVQSSTAITVMTVNLVDKGMMTLEQAAGVILGANIGTATTGLMAALPIRFLAPLLLVGGALLVLGEDVAHRLIGSLAGRCRARGSLAGSRRAGSAGKIPGKGKTVGAVSMGLGMLLLGMELMQAAMAPYRSSPALLRLMTGLGKPLAGVLGGAAFTAIIQSSSASVAILQSLAAEGIVGLQQSAYIVYGQNIGTCVTALWASAHLSPAARSCARLHLLINLLGTGIFLAADCVLPLTAWIGSWTPDSPALQVANLHLFFNLASTVLLLPFGRQLVKISLFFPKFVLYNRQKKGYDKA